MGITVLDTEFLTTGEAFVRTCRIAVRDWDHLTPLLLGEVDLTPLRDAGVDLVVDRVSPLPAYADPRYDATELSMSQYWRARAAGDDRMVALPHVLMRGFRHRCLVVPRDSTATSAADLAGGSIGVTGWPDSGNTWTRTALADDGLDLGSVRWVAGRLTADHPVQDRLQGFGVPGRIEADPDERPMVDLLLAGELAAVATPFMPPGFFAAGSPLRPLYADLVATESAWYAARGFVPGMHLLAFRDDRLDPVVAPLVSDALAASAAQWHHKRQRYADTTPWLLPALLDEARLAPDWNDRGMAANGAMFAEFGRQLVAQGLLEAAPALDDLFPLDVTTQEAA